jgi:cation diffusion facilitator family transporter
LSADPPTQPSAPDPHDHPHDDAHDHPHPHDDAHDHPQVDAQGHPHDDAHDHPHPQDHPHDDTHDHHGGLWNRVRNLYRPHSHDAADSIDSALESSAKGVRAVKISLAGLMATAVFQVLIVVLTGSVALLADTIHNFSDALTSIPLWIAFVVGRRVATRSYSYGYRRAEDLSGLFIVAMIAFSAVLAGWESIQRLISPQEVRSLGLVVAAGVIGFVGNEAVAVYRIRVGRAIGSAALIADGQHARTDGFTSLAVVLGAAGVALGFPAADPIIGLLITIAILFVLRDASRQVFRRLMDAIDPETIELVESTAAAVDGVSSVHGVRVRWLGHRLDASLHVTVDEDISVANGHAVAEAARHALFHALPSLDEVTIHVDPDGGDHHHEITRHHSARANDGVGNS